MTGKSLIEVGSKANIIISFVVETIINGKTYAADEPYIYIKDALTLLKYKEFNKQGSAVKNVVSYNLKGLESLIIGQVSLTKKIVSLLIAYTGDTVSEGKKEFSVLTASGNVIYMNKEVYDDTSAIIYDSSFTKITDVTYTAASNSFTSPNITDGLDYTISFSSEIVGTKYSLDQSNVPYMSIQIQGVGNIDKQTKNIIIKLGKVALKSMVEFNFIPKDLIKIPIEFIIIDDVNNYIIFED